MALGINNIKQASPKANGGRLKFYLVKLVKRIKHGIRTNHNRY